MSSHQRGGQRSPSLYSIKESSKELSERSARESQQSIDPLNKRIPNRISSTNGYDYLGSIIEPKMIASDTDTESDSSAIKNQLDESDSSVIRNESDSSLQNFASSERSSMEVFAGSERVSMENGRESMDEEMNSSGRQLHRHSTISSLHDFTQSLRSKDDSYIGPRKNSRLSSFDSLRNYDSGRPNDSMNNFTMSNTNGKRPHRNDSITSFTASESNGSLNSFGPVPSALKRGPKNRNVGVSVSFEENVLNKGRDKKIRNSVYTSQSASRDSFIDPSEEIKGSEQLFTVPDRQFRQVSFLSNHVQQPKDSMMDELTDIEEYLSSLKQSIVETKRSINITPKEKSDSAIDGRPRLDSASNNPKSRRRFSMAYRTTDEVVTFPDDCFSFLIVHGPIESPYFFFFGFGISMLQLGFLILALLSMVHPQWTATGATDNPQSYFFYFPSNVTGLVRTTQILAVISYCLFADMSVKDYLTALDLFPQYSKVTKKDKYWCMVFSCVLRFSMGFLTFVVTLIMLLTNTSVIDTILDFLAMNFISDIGKMAFQLCLWGKYGRRLEAEARRLEDAPLPQCMLRQPNPRRYRLMVTPIIALASLILSLLMFAQAYDGVWTTQAVRVQIVDNSALDPYSGCYVVNDHRDAFINNRLQYDSHEDNRQSARFAYCRSDSRWYLYNSDKHEPCDLLNDEILLQSSATSAFDINGAKSAAWMDADGTPITLYFFMESEEEILDTCDSFKNDGNCDSIFNLPDRDFDGGDCCASTCTHSLCGVGELVEAFGTSIDYGDGFPTCKNPSMKPITIKIETLIDSVTYHQQDHQQQREQNLNGAIKGLEELQVHAIRPKVAEPLMILDCDDRNILTLHVSEKMEGQMETVKVEDGANCTIRVNNMTISTHQGENPIWYVNYTVYHGDEDDVEKEPIVIIQEQSANTEYSTFARLPECYFTKLSDYLDVSTIYTGEGPENHAIKWSRLSSGYTRNAECEDDYFLERYALSVLNFAALIRSTEDDPISQESLLTADENSDAATIEISVGNTSLEVSTIESIPSSSLLEEVTRDFLNKKYLWIEDTRQCIWRKVGCDHRTVDTLEIQNMQLAGTIASSIGMLSNLVKFDMAGNQLKGPIPSEIWSLESLHFLNIANNALSGTIPSEVGNADTLEVISAGANNVKGTIPTEIGQLTSMVALNLTKNFFSGTIPTEIGGLTALQALDLSNNLLTGTIPNEIGNLALSHNLTMVFVGNNAGLAMNLSMPGLRDVVYTGCSTQGCQPRQFDTADMNNTVTMTHCAGLLKDFYERYRQQVPVDVCKILKSNCLVCS
mmetsp:Transcript_12694/g.31961  ORF Transcript_12694/g.31961 Transcript_12694/m.31961 type:complete len:1307 (-) Transcript_12694:198-4118(-)